MTNQVQNALFGMYDGLNQVRDDATRRRAGQAWASGDQRGAADMLAQGGDIQSAAALYDRMDDRQRQDAGDALQVYSQMIGMLQRGYRQGGPEALRQGVEMIRPYLARMPGSTPEMIDQVSVEVLSNPGILDVWGEQIEQQYRYFNVGGEIVRVPESGQDAPQVIYQSQRPFSVDGTTYYPSAGPQGALPEVLDALPPDARIRPRPSEPASGQRERAGFDDEQGARAWIAQLVPGVSVTSGRRSVARNAAVGGAERSYHLSGRALDLVPPPGMSMADLERQLRGSGMRFTELLNEGDHVHMAW